MASKKQVEAKAAKLGGKLTINNDGAELQSPQGKHWDGYHNQVDYFNNDGKQAIWDAFLIAINNEEECNCNGTNTEARSAFQLMMEESRRCAELQLNKTRKDANVSGSK